MNPDHEHDVTSPCPLDASDLAACRVDDFDGHTVFAELSPEQRLEWADRAARVFIALREGGKPTDPSVHVSSGRHFHLGSLPVRATSAMDASESQLQRAIFRDKAANSRQMNPGEKLVAGARLYDMARHRMLAGIRFRHPEWGDAEVEAEFVRQMAILRELDERGVYTPCGSL